MPTAERQCSQFTTASQPMSHMMTSVVFPLCYEGFINLDYNTWPTNLNGMVHQIVGAYIPAVLVPLMYRVVTNPKHASGSVHSYAM